MGPSLHATDGAHTPSMFYTIPKMIGECYMGDRAAKNELFDQFARVGKALSSGKRLELLDLLAQSERTVDALARASELGLTTASAHLQTLKAAKLVSTRRDGTKVIYRLAGTDVAELFTLVR